MKEGGACETGQARNRGRDRGAIPTQEAIVQKCFRTCTEHQLIRRKSAVDWEEEGWGGGRFGCAICDALLCACKPAPLLSRTFAVGLNRGTICQENKQAARVLPRRTASSQGCSSAPHSAHPPLGCASGCGSQWPWRCLNRRISLNQRSHSARSPSHSNPAAASRACFSGDSWPLRCSARCLPAQRASSSSSPSLKPACASPCL